MEMAQAWSDSTNIQLLKTYSVPFIKYHFLIIAHELMAQVARSSAGMVLT